MRVRLHWLPFPQRIKFKLCSTVYKCLHDAAPAYQSEFCVPLSSQAGHSQLRSAAAGDLLIPPTRTVTIGGRGFSVAGPVAWNSLPTDLKDGTLTSRNYWKHIYLLRYEQLHCAFAAIVWKVHYKYQFQFNSIQRMSHDHDMTYVKKWTLIVSLWLRIRMQIKCSASFKRRFMTHRHRMAAILKVWSDDCVFIKKNNVSIWCSSNFQTKKIWFAETCARDLNCRDRDQDRDLSSRDRDETETFAYMPETRPRRDLR